MKHPSVLTEPRICANLTRCRKSLPKYESRLSSWKDEVDSLQRAGLPVPDWIHDRIRSCETKVWFYQTRIKEYEDALVRLDEGKRVEPPQATSEPAAETAFDWSSDRGEWLRRLAAHERKAAQSLMAQSEAEIRKSRRNPIDGA